MNIFMEFIDDVNAIIWRYTVPEIRRCKTPGCTKNAVSGKNICMGCARHNDVVQQTELFSNILSSLEKIEAALSSNNSPRTPERIDKINKHIEEQQNVFIPSIEIPETGIQVLNEKKSTVTKNVSQLAKDLNSVNKEE